MSADNLPAVVATDIDELAEQPTLLELRRGLESAAAPIRRAIDGILDSAEELAESDDLAGLARLLRGMRLLRSALLAPILDDLSVLDRQVEDMLSSRMSTKELEVPGVGLVERRRKYGSVSWDGQGLMLRISREMIDTESGEIVRSIPLEVAKLCLPQATAPSATWKAQGLQASGIDPDDYRSRQPDRWQLTISDRSSSRAITTTTTSEEE